MCLKLKYLSLGIKKNWLAVEIRVLEGSNIFQPKLLKLCLAVKKQNQGHTCISNSKIGSKTSLLLATRSFLVSIIFKSKNAEKIE